MKIIIYIGVVLLEIPFCHFIYPSLSSSLQTKGKGIKLTSPILSIYLSTFLQESCHHTLLAPPRRQVQRRLAFPTKNKFIKVMLSKRCKFSNF